jgi:hypothetical protein
MTTDTDDEDIPCYKPRFWKENKKRMSKNPIITTEYKNL